MGLIYVEKTGQTTLYTRTVDGNHPIHILPNGKYELVKPSGVKVYPSARQLLIAVTGHPKARNWTFDRYFRQGEWDTTPDLVRQAEGFLDWFHPVQDTVTCVQNDDAFSVSESTARHLAQQAHGPGGLGIDLVNRADEVAKLLFAGFGHWIYTAGYDPQEVLQEVYLGLAVRNQGSCPWDGKKSSFGHYVHMVCNGVLSNYHRKRKRVSSNEKTGIRAYDEHGDFLECDVASTQLPAPPTSEETIRDELRATRSLQAFIPDKPDTRLAKKILPYIKDGYTRTDIARRFGLTRTKITEALAILQHWAGRWAAQR